jgi:hypothetical protein
MLSTNDALAQQRQANMYNTIKLHDWRYRIKTLCALFDLPLPDTLHDDIARLQDLSTLFKPV